MLSGMAAMVAAVPPLPRIALFMDPPLIGGAEMHFRAILRGVDTATLEIVAVVPDWPPFHHFLVEEPRPDFSLVPIDLWQPGVVATPGTANATTAVAKRPQTSRLRQIYRALPMRRFTDPTLVALTRELAFRSNIRRFRRVLQTQHIDMLHVVNGGYPGSAAALAAVVAGKQVGIPVVQTVCSIPQPREFPKHAARRIDQVVAEACNIVIVPGPRSREALEQLRDFPTDRIRIVPWGPPAPPRPAADEIAAAKASFDLPPEAPVVGMLATFTPTKGHLALVEAAALLKDRYPDLVTLMGGHGPLFAEVTAAVSDRALDGSVRLVGPINDAFELFRASDVVVLPSEVEGLPYVVLEAMSQGVPVVAADVGDMPIAVRPGQTGLLVQPKAPRQLADAIQVCLEDAEDRRRMGEAAHQLFEQVFTHSAMMEAHHRIYAELLRR
jgi:glycosyltransferase involved in cell wall biosynthesis